jgi:hypothetical protein
MTPIVEGYGVTIGEVAADEVAGEPTDLDDFSAQYAATMAARHVGSSQGQLNQIVRESESGEELPLLDERYAEWEAKRPDKIGRRESVQAGAALAIATWSALGVPSLTWVTAGKNCPLCNEMDGRTISMGGAFLQAGDQVDPQDGETAPITATGSVGHPQLHQGCDCMVAPA